MHLKISFTILVAFLVSSCSSVPKATDQLYFHGFVAADNAIEFAETDSLTIELRDADKVINSQTIPAPIQLPVAYQIFYTPNDIENGELTITIKKITAEQSTDLLKQEIEESHGAVFSSHNDLIISESSSEINYQTLECEEQDYKVLIFDSYILFNEDMQVLPKVARQPVLDYSAFNTTIQFDANGGTVTVNGKTDNCKAHELLEPVIITPETVEDAENGETSSKEAATK